MAIDGRLIGESSLSTTVQYRTWFLVGGNLLLLLSRVAPCPKQANPITIIFLTPFTRLTFSFTIRPRILLLNVFIWQAQKTGDRTYKHRSFALSPFNWRYMHRYSG